MHSHQLKKNLLPAIEGSPVKPFFLGHIAVELILDSLLIITQKVKVDDFYNHLHNCDNEVIMEFFNAAGLKDLTFFFKYFEKFKAERYLKTYVDVPQITYALRRICMRIWQQPFTSEHEEDMTAILADYRTMLGPDFMLVFNEIEEKMAV